MIVDILIAKGEAIDPLRHQFLNAVFDPLRSTVVGKAGAKAVYDACKILPEADFIPVLRMRMRLLMMR